jgi:hypothetical protein
VNGTIQIRFTDTTHIKKLHPFCRSNTGLLKNADSTSAGELECLVEGNSWIIIGFAQVAAN